MGIDIHRAGVASWALVYPIDLVSGEHGSILTLHATKKLIKSSTPSQVKAKVQRNALADAPYERPWHVFQRLSSGGVTKLYRGLGISAGRSVFTHGLLCTFRSRSSACPKSRAESFLRDVQGRYLNKREGQSFEELDILLLTMQGKNRLRQVVH